MKTPTLKEVKEYFKNAKEVKFNGYGHDVENITEIIGNLGKGSKDLGDIYTEYCGKNNVRHLLYESTSNKYAEIISYIEPTTKVRNSVLLQLADNNSFSEEILKKECPKLFIPTDIITIVDKYGKDNVIKLIKKM
jgi:hypothetical protein